MSKLPSFLSVFRLRYDLPRRPSEEAITEDLRSLGDTPGDIARTLGDMGLRGITSSNDDCVIARFLVRKFPSYNFRVGIVTSTSFVNIEASLKGTQACRQTEVSSKALHDFISSFDSQEYPALVAGRRLGGQPLKFGTILNEAPEKELVGV